MKKYIKINLLQRLQVTIEKPFGIYNIKLKRREGFFYFCETHTIKGFFYFIPMLESNPHIFKGKKANLKVATNFLKDYITQNNSVSSGEYKMVMSMQRNKKKKFIQNKTL